MFLKMDTTTSLHYIEQSLAGRSIDTAITSTLRNIKRNESPLTGKSTNIV